MQMTQVLVAGSSWLDLVRPADRHSRATDGPGDRASAGVGGDRPPRDSVSFRMAPSRLPGLPDGRQRFRAADPDPGLTTQLGLPLRLARWCPEHERLRCSTSRAQVRKQSRCCGVDQAELGKSPQVIQITGARRSTHATVLDATKAAAVGTVSAAGGASP